MEEDTLSARPKAPGKLFESLTMKVPEQKTTIFSNNLANQALQNRLQNEFAVIFFKLDLRHKFF